MENGPGEDVNMNQYFFKGQLRKLSCRVKILRRAKKELKTRYNILEERVQHHEYKTLQKESDFLEERLQNLRLKENLRILEEDNISLNMKLLSKTSSILPMEELKTELESVVKENALLSSQLSAMEDNKVKFGNMINEHKDQIKLLKTGMDDIKAENEELKLKVSEMAKNEEESNHITANLSGAKQALEKEVLSLNNENTVSKTLLVKTEVDMKKLEGIVNKQAIQVRQFNDLAELIQFKQIVRKHKKNDGDLLRIHREVNKLMQNIKNPKAVKKTASFKMACTDKSEDVKTIVAFKEANCVDETRTVKRTSSPSPPPRLDEKIIITVNFDN